MANEENVTGEKQESKADRFKRLSEPRVANAVKKIEIIGNLAGSNYEFTSEQINQMLATLKTAVGEVEAKFQKVLTCRGV